MVCALCRCGGDAAHRLTVVCDARCTRTMRAPRKKSKKQRLLERAQTSALKRSAARLCAGFQRHNRVRPRWLALRARSRWHREYKRLPHMRALPCISITMDRTKPAISGRRSGGRRDGRHMAASGAVAGKRTPASRKARWRDGGQRIRHQPLTFNISQQKRALLSAQRKARDGVFAFCVFNKATYLMAFRSQRVFARA